MKPYTTQTRIAWLIFGVVWMLLWMFITVGIVSFMMNVARADSLNYDRVIKASARDFNVDPDLIAAVIEVESSWNHKAVGPSGEIGLMQLHPKFHPYAIAFDPETDWQWNIYHGTRHLNNLRKQCGQKLMQSPHPYTWVIAYNQGCRRTPKYPQLHPYYKKVMKAYARRLAVKN
jgi:membrane-bound lytic murein transglycosylase MltF